MVKIATIMNVSYLGVGSNELHGSNDSFSGGESFPAWSEEQRLLSVRPEHNPEQGDIMLEILIGERLQIKKDPHPTTSKWIYLFPFLAHTYQVITKLLPRLDNSFESWPTLFSSHQAGTGKSSKWSRLASFDSSSLACTWHIGEKKKTFNCAMSFLVISIAMKRGRGCLTWRCFQPPFFQRYCLFWSWPEWNTDYDRSTALKESN